MTVRELIIKLLECDLNTEIVLVCSDDNYAGNHVGF